jgi:hypothetical protein
VCPLARHVRSTLRSRHRQATRSGPVRAVSDILHRSASLFDRPVDDGTAALPRRSSIMDIDRDHIDDAVLALLFLERHDGMRTWKSFDWAAMERLHTKGLISDSVAKLNPSYSLTRPASVRSTISKAVQSRMRSMRRVAPESSLTAAHRPSRYFTDQCNELPPLHRSPRPTEERSFTLLLVHRIIPKAIEFFLDHPPDIPPA